MDESQKNASGRAFSPYLRKPIRSLEEARHEGHSQDSEACEQARERLDNNVFRMSNAR